jgi:hypothetical protein
MTEQTTFKFRHRRGAPRLGEEARREFKRQVKKLLRTKARGRGAAIRASVIREVAGLPKTLTEELVRELIRELIADGNPIGSRGKGYFLIETMEELKEVVDGLRARQEGIETRIRLISQAYGCNGVIPEPRK